MKGDESLGSLEEILIRFVGSELNLENHLATSFNLGIRWSNPEGVLDPVACGSIHHFKQLPVDLNSEWMLVLHGQRF